MITICPDVQPVNLRRLAAMVCLRAIEETRSRDPLTALDAILWLLSDDFGLWAGAANLPFADIVRLLTSGQRMRTKTKGNQYANKSKTKVRCIKPVRGDGRKAGQAIQGGDYSHVAGITARDRNRQH